MAEAASKSRLAAHARVQLARVLEAAGDADTAETLYGSVVEWSQTPRPRQVRELLFVVLAGSPGRRRCGAWRGWRQPAGTTTRPTTCKPTPLRSRSATAPRPTRCKGRLWRPDRCAGAGSPGGPTVASGVEFQEKLPDQSSRGVSGCRSSGPRRGPRDRDPRHGSAASLRRVAAASNPAHARRALAVSPGHGSRVAAALASLARKRRLADRARGDV
jgi:hypothetical protein